MLKHEQRLSLTCLTDDYIHDLGRVIYVSAL